jgi:hypothetical protein
MKSILSFTFLFFLISCSAVRELPIINQFTSTDIDDQDLKGDKVRLSVTCFEELDENTYKVIVGHLNSHGKEYHILSGENNLLYSLDKNKKKVKDKMYKDYIVEAFIPGVEYETATIDSLVKDNNYFWKLGEHVLDLSYKNNNKCSDNKKIFQRSFELSYTLISKRNIKLIWRDLEKDQVSDYHIETSIDGISYAQIYKDETLKTYRSIASKKDQFTFDHVVSFPYEGNWFIRLKRVEKNNSYEYKELKVNLK